MQGQKSDVRKARAWYDQQQSGLGNDFVSAIEDAFDVLQQNPHVCQVYHKKYRQFLPTRFPYRIMYFINGRPVVIARVFHTSQDFNSLI